MSKQGGFHNMLGRVGGFPVVDVLGTAVLGYGATRLTGYSPWTTIPAAFAVGHLAHFALDVTTVLNDGSTPRSTQLEEDAASEVRKLLHELRTNSDIHASFVFVGSYALIRKLFGLGEMASMFSATGVAAVVRAVTA